jgi:hypothetical protein
VRARLQLPVDPHTLPAVTTRLRALSEAEAYARCYGGAGEDVKVVRVPRRPRYQLDVSGEDLRAAFAERLDRREPELAEALEREDAFDVPAASHLDEPLTPSASLGDAVALEPSTGEPGDSPPADQVETDAAETSHGEEAA